MTFDWPWWCNGLWSNGLEVGCICIMNHQRYLGFLGRTFDYFMHLYVDTWPVSDGGCQRFWCVGLMRLVGYAMRLDIWREKVRETMSPTHWVLCQGSQFNISQPTITATIAIGVISIHSCGNEVQQTLSIPMNLCFCETFVTNQETFSTSKFSGRMFMLLSWTN